MYCCKASSDRYTFFKTGLGKDKDLKYSRCWRRGAGIFYDVILRKLLLSFQKCHRYIIIS